MATLMAPALSIDSSRYPMWMVLLSSGDDDDDDDESSWPTTSTSWPNITTSISSSSSSRRLRGLILFEYQCRPRRPFSVVVFLRLIYTYQSVAISYAELRPVSSLTQRTRRIRHRRHVTRRQQRDWLNVVRDCCGDARCHSTRQPSAERRQYFTMSPSCSYTP